jgi:hypothetical protein
VITSVCWENKKPTELLHIKVIQEKVAINQQEVLGSNYLFSFGKIQTGQKTKKLGAGVYRETAR